MHALPVEQPSWGRAFVHAGSHRHEAIVCCRHNKSVLAPGALQVLGRGGVIGSTQSSQHPNHSIDLVGVERVRSHTAGHGLQTKDQAVCLIATHPPRLQGPDSRVKEMDVDACPALLL